MQHFYVVTSPEHQPEWPVNDNEPAYQPTRFDWFLTWGCVGMVVLVVVPGLAALAALVFGS